MRHSADEKLGWRFRQCRSQVEERQSQFQLNQAFLVDDGPVNVRSSSGRYREELKAPSSPGSLYTG